jgi:hypothetical protein
MKFHALTNPLTQETGGFDLFRLSRSKDVVDLCPNTLRAYHRRGLSFYRNGKVVFISKSELASFIRTAAAKTVEN